ncbi:MAG: glycoside hydrolase family 2 protein [Treponema sp.]|nr:glycoside hydrolase family 2 protein [Treponema sp.]
MKQFLNYGWQYTDEFNRQLLSLNKKLKLQNVDIPHSVVITPFNYFSETLYQKISGYRKTFKTSSKWENRRVFIIFEGVAHEATVYFNGKLLGTHSCGYTAFSFEITEYLAPKGKENVLAVKVDSNENLDIPPFGKVIDYMTFGGIYRSVYIEDKPEIFIEDVFVTTKKTECNFKIEFSSIIKTDAQINVIISKWKKGSKLKIIKTFLCEITAGEKIIEKKFPVEEAEFWSPENPVLYTAEIQFIKESKICDAKSIRFGFRDIIFNSKGFSLNGNKYKIRGLNRHQSYPYVGYAACDSLQKFDVKILKDELCLNAVRTSHYPQSQSFVDACDEEGLLVFTEIPGWQYIGKSTKWKKQAIDNTREMVLQYRNHPSVILWGVRINESPDDDQLYSATNEMAHKLDPSRPTGGVRNFKKSSFLEDVYTYNDFSCTGKNEGCVSKRAVTSDKNKAYLISEYNGHMFPTKVFDDELHRLEHALRHAKVMDSVSGKDDIAGSFGWCAFDYNTHRDFGSGDRICYHGVMDMFRNPKLASYVYKSQSEKENVLEVSTSMDIGEHPAGIRGKNWIFTNADSVKMYFNNIFIAEFFPHNSPFKNLAHPPVLIDDFIGSRFEKEEGMTKKTADQAKALLNFAAMYGEVKLPFNLLLKGAFLILKGTGYKKLRKLYDEYVGNWGGEASVYKFEAIKNSKVVKTVLKGPAEKLEIHAEFSKTELDCTDGYDQCLVRVCVTDQNGNVLPYYSEPVSFEAKGSVCVMGPCFTAFKGGFSGTIVKTTGKKGRGELTVRTGELRYAKVFTVVKKQ